MSEPSSPAVQPLIPASTVKDAGPALHVFPGYVWNSWEQVWLRVTHTNAQTEVAPDMIQQPRFLCLYNNSQEEKLLQKIPLEEVSVASRSQKNEFVFIVQLKTEEEKAQKTSSQEQLETTPTASKKYTKPGLHYFKVQTVDERDKWVVAINSYVTPSHKPASPIPPEQLPSAGYLLNVHPGYIYNSWEQVWVKIIDNSPGSPENTPTRKHVLHLTPEDGAAGQSQQLTLPNGRWFVLYDSEKEERVVECVSFSDVESISKSKNNEYVFTVQLKSEAKVITLTPTGTTPQVSSAGKQYHFKVLTTSEDRNKWVVAFANTFLHL